MIVYFLLSSETRLIRVRKRVSQGAMQVNTDQKGRSNHDDKLKILLKQ